MLVGGGFFHAINNIAFERRTSLCLAKGEENVFKYIISCCQHNLCCSNFNKTLCYHCCLFKTFSAIFIKFPHEDKYFMRQTALVSYLLCR